jgi:cytochrome c peroxidase
VAVTPPYLHDGSVKTLEDAVKIMARYQLGKQLDEADVTKIVAFLRTLTGEYQGKPLE